MKDKLNALSTKHLLHLYGQHTEVFNLEYCADKELKQMEYKFRKTILEILTERLERERR